MKRLVCYFLAVISILAFTGLLSSCGGKDEPDVPDQEEFSLMISITSPLEVYEGQDVAFKVYSNKGPKLTDKVILKSGSNSYECPIKVASSDSFTFTIVEGIPSGTYSFCVQRGDVVKNVGSLNLTVIKVAKVEPKEGYNVYGTVTCDNTGVADIIVSDGIEFTKTDKDGIFYLKSSERYSIVYITIPSGYEVDKKGVIPQFYKNLDGDSSTTERADFSLTKVSGQDTHTMLFFGDMHLANRTNDLNQFHVFTDEVNEYLKANSSKKIYAQSLGDMTWDLYWYTKKMTPNDYVTEINSDFSKNNLMLFHCIGNHDHEMGDASVGFPVGDLNCEAAYRKALGPNFYSYNIGKIHYVVIDDINCTNSGSGERTYVREVVSDQLQWLKKDLSYVSKSTPVVVMSHAPLYDYTGKGSLENNGTATLLSYFEGYKTYFITGHTHRMYNTDNLSSSTASHIELNSGSVCATWWWTGQDTAGLYLAKDGSNGGYRVFEVNGTDIKWYYKSTAKDASVQFRTYDGNQVSIPSSVSNVSSPWNSASTDDYVYIEVWDYDPSWTISVTENGKSLTPTRIKAYDPLHYLAYEGKGRTTKDFYTSITPNMFRVKASGPSTTLEIKVTDRFGRVYSESMKRPRTFSLAEYNK